jgi:hypothetical protein
VELAGVRFLGGTLWAGGRLSGGRLSGIDATPDHETRERIEVAHAGGARRITVGDAIGLHRKTRRALDRLLAAPRDGRKVVVVTHHAPHPLCLPPAACRLPPGARSGWVAGISASDLSGLMASRQVDLWVHGHIHPRIDITHPRGTRIICNAAGPGFRKLGFQEDWAVEV